MPLSHDDPEILESFGSAARSLRPVVRRNRMLRAGLREEGRGNWIRPSAPGGGESRRANRNQIAGDRRLVQMLEFGAGATLLSGLSDWWLTLVSERRNGICMALVSNRRKLKSCRSRKNCDRSAIEFGVPAESAPAACCRISRERSGGSSVDPSGISGVAPSRAMCQRRGGRVDPNIASRTLNSAL